MKRHRERSQKILLLVFGLGSHRLSVLGLAVPVPPQQRISCQCWVLLYLFHPNEESAVSAGSCCTCSTPTKNQLSVLGLAVPVPPQRRISCQCWVLLYLFHPNEESAVSAGSCCTCSTPTKNQLLVLGLAVPVPPQQII